MSWQPRVVYTKNQEYVIRDVYVTDEGTIDGSSKNLAAFGSTKAELAADFNRMAAAFKEKIVIENDDESLVIGK
ncbi:hypothetical protein NVP1081O_120 [Vibrio phage 1.081.O._10N.286.52.C2]|nr:hypothetical protein NVP1081O_120 [Vibrio phage 1.081.O._10N.286.52.C2]